MKNNKPFLTQSNRIKGLTKVEYSVLKKLCHFSKNLYNVGLYNIRQHYFETKEYLPYEENYHCSKNNENYKLLQAGVSQQILKSVDRSFQSFFELLKKVRSNEYSEKVNLPRYLEKEGLYPLILSTNAIRIKNGFFYLPLSNRFKKQTGLKELKFSFPPNLVGKRIKEVRILPRAKGKQFYIQYIYEMDIQPKVELDTSKALSIDVGLNNLATCVTSDGLSYLYDGKKLKSINHYYNKRKAFLQSIAMKQGRFYTNRLYRMELKRNNQMKDYFHKVAKSILNICLEQNIGIIVVGYNKDFKRNINLGKRNNQQFTQIPFGLLRKYLKYLCQQNGLQYVEQEESYTSKASFFDNDNIPTYGEEVDKKSFSGKRLKRGLYQIANGYCFNADVNGALNILHKSNLINLSVLQAKGCLTHPQRVYVQ